MGPRRWLSQELCGAGPCQSGAGGQSPPWIAGSQEGHTRRRPLEQPRGGLAVHPALPPPPNPAAPSSFTHETPLLSKTIEIVFEFRKENVLGREEPLHFPGYPGVPFGPSFQTSSAGCGHKNQMQVQSRRPVEAPGPPDAGGGGRSHLGSFTHTKRGLRGAHTPWAPVWGAGAPSAGTPGSECGAPLGTVVPLRRAPEPAARALSGSQSSQRLSRTQRLALRAVRWGAGWEQPGAPAAAREARDQSRGAPRPSLLWGGPRGGEPAGSAPASPPVTWVLGGGGGAWSLLPEGALSPRGSGENRTRGPDVGTRPPGRGSIRPEPETPESLFLRGRRASPRPRNHLRGGAAAGRRGWREAVLTAFHPRRPPGDWRGGSGPRPSPTAIKALLPWAPLSPEGPSCRPLARRTFTE